MQMLVDVDVFLVNYIVMVDVIFSFSCVEDDDIGRVFKVMVLFLVGVGENVDMLLFYLFILICFDDIVEGNLVLVYYVFQLWRVV